MKRSLAPSQLKARTQTTPLPDENGEITIQRMPLIPFLIIPETLQRQFKVPTGCKITQESIELRKVKTLGLRKVFREIRPCDIANGVMLANRPLPTLAAEEGEDEEVVEDVTCELPPYDPLVLWTSDDGEHKIEVIPSLACRLRPHQREGVAFLFECTMGLRSFDGHGCILADAMGLGKTLMSITLLWTLLNQGMDGTPTVIVELSRALNKIDLINTTLENNVHFVLGNWNNELVKWVGDTCPTFPVKDGDAKTIIKHYLMSRSKAILIVSYETQRRYHKLFHANKNANAPSVCDLLICDEAHKLKNSESGLAKTLNAIPTMRRILLSGTPIQNDLMEFYSMVSFCNPKVLGSSSQFKKQYVNKILLGMERDSTKSERDCALALQTQLSNIVNEFILKRGNILNAQHLPSKYVQHVCCRMTPLQEELYIALINSKEVQYSINGKHGNVLNHIRYLMLICNHPVLLAGDSATEKPDARTEARGVKVNYNESGEVANDDPILKQLRQKLVEMNITPAVNSKAATSSVMRKAPTNRFNPELSGKFLVLYRLLLTLYHRYDDKIVLISNYTSILGLMQLMCEDNRWNYVRLDGSTNSNKRQQLVDRFNSCPGRGSNGIFVFLLSSKAGGCGLNLIGANRLVLMDPDWNPASDKQAAARIWREGQKKPSYIYHFSSTSSIEEKIIQRQLSKEGLKSAIEGGNGGPVASGGFSTSELKALFCYNTSNSDTHDAIRCERCPTNKSKRGSTTSLTVDQLALCSNLLQNMKAALLVDVTEENKLKIDLSCMDKLIEDIVSSKFSLLAHISKECRDTMKYIDEEYGEYLTVCAFDTYIAQWMQLIPKLTLTTRDATIETVDCSVPQIGCPDEDDFNSHHNSVNTSEDEALRLAMADDDTVSFIFALRINWDLLQLRMQEDAEAEARKKQRIAASDDLEADVSSEASDMELDSSEDDSANDELMEQQQSLVGNKLIQREEINAIKSTQLLKSKDQILQTNYSDNNAKKEAVVPGRKSRTSVVIDSDSDDELVMVSKPASKTTRERKSPHKEEIVSNTAPTGWICAACTYMNSADAGRRCALCERT